MAHEAQGASRPPIAHRSRPEFPISASPMLPRKHRSPRRKALAKQLISIHRVVGGDGLEPPALSV
jgi:hypothetical protein